MRIIAGEFGGVKLYTLEGNNTRPTLERVKESLFSIINPVLEDKVVLDLFAGSGALGLESLSRGAKKAIFCDNTRRAIEVINSNVEKTKVKENSLVLYKSYEKALKILKEQNEKLDIVFLDPPYEKDYDLIAIDKILEYNLLQEGRHNDCRN